LRVAFVGIRGISHWVGPLETGKIDPEFDRWFLERLVSGEAEQVTEKFCRREELESVAGNGGNEIREWLAVAAAMPPQLRPEVLAYEPIPQWATGTGVMAWSQRITGFRKFETDLLLLAQCNGRLQSSAPPGFGSFRGAKSFPQVDELSPIDSSTSSTSSLIILVWPRSSIQEVARRPPCYCETSLVADRRQQCSSLSSLATDAPT
jgi:hypothetical protein